MAQAHASSLLQLEAQKLRLAHNEKLIALCAAILALSFTASTAFHGSHNREVAAWPDLLRSWQLFMLAMGLGVLTNWLGVTGIANFANSAFYKQIGVHFDLLHVNLMKLAPDYARKERESWDRHRKGYAHTEKVSDICIRLGALVGTAAQALAFVAFIYLYLFAKALLAP